MADKSFPNDLNRRPEVRSRGGTGLESTFPFVEIIRKTESLTRKGVGLGMLTITPMNMI